MTNLLLISGSQRRESWNSRLLQQLAFTLQWQCDVDVLEPRGIALPLYDQDLETDAAVLLRLTDLHQRFVDCHGFIVACPEYNGQVTPLLKNTIDWVSRLARIDSRFGNPFLNKPVLLCSASTGHSAGNLVIQNLRTLFGYVGAAVMGPSVGIALAQEQWTSDGFQFDGATEMRIEAALSELLLWAEPRKSFSEREALAN